MLKYVIVGVNNIKGGLREDEPISAYADKWLADEAMAKYKELSGVADKYDSLEMWDYTDYFSD